MATRGWDQEAVDKANGKITGATKVKKNKMLNQKTRAAGKEFGSKKESERFTDVLFPAQQAKEITELKCHPRFKIVVNGIHICDYEADFSYKNKKKKLVVEDVKGRKKGGPYEKFRLKKKLMEAVHQIIVVEI